MRVIPNPYFNPNKERDRVVENFVEFVKSKLSENFEVKTLSQIKYSPEKASELIEEYFKEWKAM